MDRELLRRYGTGEARALFAEGWFSFLGFTAATGVLHAVAEKSGAMPVVTVKWLSYLMLWWWLSYKVDRLIWMHFPVVDPLKRKATLSQIAFSVWLSFMITLGTYFIVVDIIDSLVKSNAV